MKERYTWGFVGCIILVFLVIFFLLMLDGGSRVSIYPRGSLSLRQQQHWRRTEMGASVCLCLGGGDLNFLAFRTAGKGGGERHGLGAIEDDDGGGVVGKLGCGERENQRG